VNKLIIAFALVFCQIAFAKTSYPKTVTELKETSVRILNLEMNRGGTGSIFRSFDNATHILTNKHICRVIEPGGVVDYKGKQYIITHYKKFADHDLCMVRIAENLGIDLEVAESLAKSSTAAIVSGHPALLPHIVTTGHLSERMDIELMVGLKPCTEEQIKADPMTCAFFGGYPVVQRLDSQLVSNLIQPGNSGSAVFNKKGELIGVVFAGTGRDFSFGFIVPQIYLLYFTQNAHRFDWTVVGSDVDGEGMSDRVFDFEKCKTLQSSSLISDRIKSICSTVGRSIIWSK